MGDKWLWTVEGKKPGKTVVVMAGVHGNEVGGIKALKRALDEIKIDSGKVYYILGNLKAIEENKRFIDKNMNRCFLEESLKDPVVYEEKRAVEILPYLNKADALLDLHSSRNEFSVPFIICEPHSFHIAKKLSFPIRSNGWDSIEPGATDGYMNKFGKISICVECGQHLDEEAPNRAFESMKAFLRLMGLIEGGLEIKEMDDQREIEVNHIYITKNNLKRARVFKDFEKIKEGELIGTDGNEKVYCHQDGVIIFSHDIEGSGEEGFILGKEK